jgi:pimeloyl-ACP methyl ester carboxylesterase
LTFLSEPCLELSFDLQAGGRRLRARAITPPDCELAGAAAALVFLHEGLGSISQWRDFPQALARATGLPALVYDRYGHGGSEPLREARGVDYLEQEARVALPELLAACGIDHPILFGQSDGATIALLFAAAFPEVPLAVIAEAAHVLIEDLSIQGIWKTLRAFEEKPLRAQLVRHHGDQVESMFYGWSNVWLSPEHHEWSMLEQLPAITAPVLAIQGAGDEYGTPEQLRAIAAGVAGHRETLLLPDCGHAPHVQARARVLAETVRFIREQARRG